MESKDMLQTRDFFNPAKLPIVYHPGETLEEKLQEMGMGVKEFATRVSKPEKTIIAVIKGKSSITPDMAVSFEMVTRIPAGLWLRYQKEYDEYIARKKREKDFIEGKSWAEKFPIEEISNLGWLSQYASVGGQSKDIVETLCLFFGVSSPKGWEDFYLNQRLRVAFRITLAETCDPYALSVWLRQGELQASEITLERKYSSNGLKKILPAVLVLQELSGENFKEELARLFAESGVKLIFTKTLSAAPVKGCTRYICGIPCIQMADSFEFSQEFWYTLFHEIGHILLHGKKDIFIENVEYGDKNPEKEREADEFASQWMSQLKTSRWCDTEQELPTT